MYDDKLLFTGSETVKYNFMHFKQAKLGNYIFIFILTAILTVNEEKMFVKNIQLAIYQGVLIRVYLVK